MRKTIPKPCGIPVSVLKPRNHQSVGITPVSRKTVLPDEIDKEKKRPSRGRASVDKLSRLSLHQGKTTPKTPNRFFTPSQNKYLNANSTQYSRSSIDTVRSSIGTKSGKQAAWPISDASFKSSQIDKLLDFLLKNNCEFSVSRQTLRSPSRKEFIAIFNFIYCHMDPEFSLSQRYEDEIPKILKALKLLKYPVQMSKSSFLNVGSPHTWPSVLAMLGWLIDVINLYHNFDENDLFFPKDFDDEMYPNEIKIRSLISFFREGEDDVSPFVKKYLKDLEKAENIEDTQLEELNLELEENIKEYESMVSVKAVVKKNAQTYEELCSDVEKLYSFNKEMKNHIQLKDKERANLAKDLEDLCEEKDQIVDQIRMLEEKKNVQCFSSSEINMYKNFKSEFTVQMNFLELEKKKYNEEIWAVEISIGKIRTKISELVIEYTSLCERRELPSCRISMSDLETNLPKWREEILLMFQNETSALKQKAFDSNNAIMLSVQEKGKIEEAVHSMECEKRKLECQAKRLQEECKHIRKEKADEEASLNVELEGLKDEVSRRKMLGTPPLKELQTQFEEKNKEMENLKHKYEEMVAASRKELQRTIEMRKYLVSERDKLLASTLKKMQDRANQALDKGKEILESLKE